MIRISVDDESPQASAELANAYVSELHAQNSRLALSESADRQAFFDAQLQAERNALAQAETNFERLSKRTGMVQVNSQVDATFKSIAQLRGGNDGEGSGTAAPAPECNSGSSGGRSFTGRARCIAVATREARRVRKTKGCAGLGGPDAKRRFGISAASLREVKYHEAVMETLAKQYEAARLDVSKEAPVIQVVDKAIAPERKTRPHRLQMAFVGTILFGLLACALVLARQGFATVSKLI